MRASFLTDKKLPEVTNAIDYLKIDEWEEGLALFNQAAKKPGLNDELKAKAYYDLGLAQMYYRKYDKAIKNLKKAMNFVPEASVLKQTTNPALNKDRYMKAIMQAKKEKKSANN